MNRKRIGTIALLSVALCLLATDPVLAQSSTTEQLYNNLNGKLLWVGVPITVLVEGILVYAVWKFRNNDDPTPTRENRRLEITWSVATAIVLLFVGLGSFLVLGSPNVALAPGDTPGAAQAQQQAQPAVTMDKPGATAPPAGSDATQVEVVGYQWAWDFNYPNQNVTSANTLVVPANTDLYLHITSTDVMHAVHVPALKLKQDAFPNKYRTIKTNVTEPGTYQLYCAEYCGSGHSKMLANMTVLPKGKYQSWLKSQRKQGNTLKGNSSSSNSSSNGSAEAALRAPRPA